MMVGSPKSSKPRTTLQSAGLEMQVCQRMIELTPAALFLLTGPNFLTARIQWANPAAASLSGSSLDGLHDLTIVDLVNPRDLAQFSDANQVSGEDFQDPSTTRFTWEFSLVNKEEPKHQTRVQATCQTIHYEGEPGWLLTAIDISERMRTERSMKKFQEELKNRIDDQMQELEEVNYNLAFELAERERMEDALEDANERLNTVLNSIAEAYFILDYDWRFVEMNHVAEQDIFQRPAKELNGKYMWEEFPQAAQTDFYTHYHEAIVTGKEQHFEAISKITGKWYETHVYPRNGRLEIYLHDVNERKEAEAESQRLLEQLEAERSLWKTTVESMPLAVTLGDAQGHATYMNPAYTEMIGRTIQKDLPLEDHPSFYQIYHTDGSLFIPEDLPLQKAALTGEEQRDAELVQRSGKGEDVYTIWNASPLRDLTGTITGSVAVGLDITAQRKAEAALKESEEQYRQLVELSRAAIVQVSEAGKVVFFNSFAQELFGYREDEVLGKSLLEASILSQDSQGRDLEGMISQIISQPERYKFYENEYIRKDGQRIWVAWTNQPLYRVDGSPAGYVSVGLDITQRKQAELEREHLLASLELERTRLRTVLETLPVGVAIADEDGHMVELNDRAKEILGEVPPISPESGVYERVEAWQPVTGEKLQIEDWGIARALLTGETVNEQVIDIRRLDGQQASLLHAAAPLRDRLGHINGAVGIVQDITRMKRVEDELRQARDELEERVEARTHQLQESNEKLSQTIEALHQTVEELSAAQGELEAQNQALIEAQGTVDLERQRYRELFEHAPDGYLVTDPHGNILEANRAASVILNRREKYLVGKPLAIFIGATEKLKYLTSLNEVKRSKPNIRSASFQELELSLIRHNLEPIEAALTMALVFKDGELAAIRWLVRDITQRRQAERALRESESLLRQVLEILPVGVWVIDARGKVRLVNQAVQRLWGEVQYVGIEEYGIYKGWMLPERTPISADEWAGARAITLGETSLNEEIEIESSDGTHRIIVNSAIPIFGPQSRVRGAIVVNQDITERKQAEDQIRHNAARAEALLRVAARLNSRLDLTTVLQTVCEEARSALSIDAVAVSLYDPHRQLFINACSCGLPQDMEDNLPTLTRAYYDEQMDPSDRVIVLDNPRDVVNSQKGGIYQTLGIRSLAAAGMVQNNQPVGSLNVFSLEKERHFNDEEIRLLKGIADQAALAVSNAQLYQELQVALQLEKAMHEQLVQAEKHMAMSRMVASVAHELNNPIQTIQNCMFLAEAEIDPGSELKQYMDMASSEAKRISKLVAQLRETYRPGVAGKDQPVDLNQLLGEVQSLLSPHLSHQNVEWLQRTGIGRMMVMGIPDQIKQVFLNISLNGIEAMQPKGGQLKVDLFIAQNQQGQPRVAVSFADDGPGIAEKIKEQIFEPFFTTKEGGTGLGLSICFDIIRRHGGEITVESDPGQGARFTVWLPILGSGSL